MKRNCFLFCVVSMLFHFVFEVGCHEKYDPCFAIQIKNKTTIKVFYTEEGFYRIYQFNHLPNQNNNLGIITNKNDTIIYRGNGNTVFDKFDIYKNGSSEKVTYFPKKILEDCSEKLTKDSKIENENFFCKMNDQSNVLGIRSDNLTVFFKCGQPEIGSRFLLHVPDNYPIRE